MSEEPDSKIFLENWNTFAALYIQPSFRYFTRIKTDEQSRESDAGRFVTVWIFFTQIINCLSSKSQTTAMINDVLEGWPRWMRESGLLDCVCKYCKYWDQTETCQTGAPRQGQPDIYLANCCWRPSLSHTTILIIHNWANCAKLGKIVERSLLASVCYTLSWYWLGRVVQNPAESQFISLNLMHNVDPFGKNRNLHFLCSMLLAKNALPIQHSVF